MKTSHQSIRRREGFTLIEILASMAVLAIMMMALLKILTEATDAVKKGNNTVLRNNSARAAMDMVIRDIEGTVIDHRLACQQVANVVNGDYDELYIVTTAGDPNDGRFYQLVKYYVTNNSDVANGFTTYRLMRWDASFGDARGGGVDPLSSTDKQWWKSISSIGGNTTVMAENIVRFDIYVQDASGNILTSGNTYDSSVTANGGYPADKPFAYIDIYLQMASEDAMKRASRLVNAGGSGPASARRMLDQESNIMIRRGVATPSYAEMARPFAN